MFDRYAAATAPSWTRRALAGASVGLHVVAAIAIAIYSIFHVEEIAPPAVSLTFFSAPPPPPPPPPPARKKQTIEKKVPQTQVVQVQNPKIVQPKQEEKKDEPEDDGEEGGQEGGQKGGQVGGTVGGQVGGTVGGTGTDLNAKPTGAPKMVPMFTLMASVISAPDPHLTDEYKSAHPQQTVKGMYKVCIAADGHVTDVTAMTAIPGMDETIIQQIKSTWKYKPQPLPVCFGKPIMFKIN